MNKRARAQVHRQRQAQIKDHRPQWTTASIVVSLLIIGVSIVVGFLFTPLSGLAGGIASILLTAGGVVFAYFQIFPPPQYPGQANQSLRAAHNEGRHQFWLTVGLATALGIVGMLIVAKVFNNISVSPNSDAGVPASRTSVLAKQEPYLPKEQEISSIHVFCPATSELCISPTPFKQTVQTHSVLKIKFFNTNCSPIRLHVFLDKKEVLTTPFLPSLGPSDSTGILDLGPVTPGQHTLGLVAEGRLGGCNNQGVIGQWLGVLDIYTS